MKKIIGLIVTVSLLGFYFFYWVCRPEYAIEQIFSSITSKDVVTFQRYFDADSIYGALFDKLSLKDKVNKDEFIEKNKNDALRFVENNLLREEGEFSYRFREALETNSIKEEQIKFTYDKDGTCIVDAVYVNLLHRWICPIRVRMAKSSDGRWKIINIMDFKLMQS